MLIKSDSIFAYPVLANFTDNYRNGELTAKIEDLSYGDNYIFKCRCNLHNNEDISSLLQSGKCQYSCLVECSKTKFRKEFTSDNPNIEIRVPKESFCHKVEFSINIIATEDIKGFTADSLSKDYAGLNIDFDKGSFLAIGPQLHKIFPVLNDENYVANNSLIYIQKSENRSMGVGWDHNKIIVYLYKEIYNTYLQRKKDKDILKLLVQMVAVPALIELLDKITNDSKDGLDENPFETKWFEKLNERCNKLFSKELNEYLADNESKLEFAQKIFKDPLAIAFSSIEKTFSLDIDEED